MPFSDLDLSRRLEQAEGFACTRHAEARRRLFPDSGAEWIECAGAYAIFDGSDSPITQSFGLGIFEPLTESALNEIELFFQRRGAPVFHEVSPYAGIAALNLLCARNYRPIEIGNVLYRSLDEPTTDQSTAELLTPAQHDRIVVRTITPKEAQSWSDVSAKGWSHEAPELGDFFRGLGLIFATREGSVCFRAELDGKAGAAGVLSIHEGVALLGGSATVPALRARGLHTALLHERLRYAFNHGCDLAMMVAQPGSISQRNAERAGFQIAYTRTKWRL